MTSRTNYLYPSYRLLEKKGRDFLNGEFDGISRQKSWPELPIFTIGLQKKEKKREREYSIL